MRPAAALSAAPAERAERCPAAAPLCDLGAGSRRGGAGGTGLGAMAAAPACLTCLVSELPMGFFLSFRVWISSPGWAEWARGNNLYLGVIALPILAVSPGVPVCVWLCSAS